MPPKAAEPLQRKNSSTKGGDKMGFSIENNLLKPTKEEIESVKWIAKNNPDDLDSKELWILGNFLEGDDDDD